MGEDTGVTRMEFEAELIKDNGTSGAGIKVPFDVQKAFGSKGRIKVKGTIDGYPYRGSIHPYGGVHYLGVRKEIRDAIVKKPGDYVSIVMEVDTEPRIVEVPGDLRRALDINEAAREEFERCSYSHKKEYVDWIVESKKPETRGRRINKLLEMLVEKKKR